VTWAKLSDDFPDDCWTLSDAAFRLHVEGLCWSNRKLLDCRIPKDDLRRFAKRPGAVAELLAVGWWSDGGDAYVIRHHADYQRTREQVVAQQEANRRNGRRGGRPPKPTSPETESVSDSLDESPSESRTERDGTGQRSYRDAGVRVSAREGGTVVEWPPVTPPGSGSAPPAHDEASGDLVFAAVPVDLDAADEARVRALATVAARQAERARQRLIAQLPRTEHVPGQQALPGLTADR
jgi:hypothetical protein